MQAEQQSERDFPFYELRFIMRVLSHEGKAPQEDWKTAYGMARQIFVRWSQDRAALSHPSTPQGWKLVPVEPTEEMVVMGFESCPSPFFSTPEEWEKFDAMSGCQQAAHRAKLCYAAMLDSAPPAQGDKGC